jgi:hypothetical protein
MKRNAPRLALAILATALPCLSPVLAATINVTANITVSETWTNDNVYVLTKPIYVTNGATLTIQSGTTVRGEPQSVPGTNDPGTLVITRGSKIRALGTVDQPIVFTDLNDNNIGSNPGTAPYDSFENALGITAQWGGLVLLGRGYVANNTLAGPDAAREVQIEGLDPSGGLGLYGNCAAVHGQPPNPLRICDDDDSGTINYLSIRYGGFNLSANNEINGLTLGAVGRATDIDYVEVLNEKDDFIEFFGGAANVKHFIGMNGGDDGVDYDEGWRGKIQFAFIVQGTPGTDKNDKGGEWDGGNNPDGSQPLTIPTIYNGTWIGLGQAKTTYTDRVKNTAFHIRDNGAVRLYNSAALDFGGATMMVEGTSSSCQGADSSGARSITPYATDGNYYIEEVSDNQLEFKNDTFWCFGNTSSVPRGSCSVSATPCCSVADCTVPQTCVDQAPTYGGDTGKIHRDIGAFSNAALNNGYEACASPLPIRTLTRTDSGITTTPDPIISIDPRPAPGSVLLTAPTRPTPADGFFEPAPYRGAFSGGHNWAAGWTTMDRLGYVAKCDLLNAPDAVPNEARGLVLTNKTTMVWTPPLGDDVETYDVVRSTDKTDFTTATCVETDDFDTTAVDATTPSVGQTFYYLVRAWNDCGGGTLGYRSSGVERAGGSCP